MKQIIVSLLILFSSFSSAQTLQDYLNRQIVFGCSEAILNECVSSELMLIRQQYRLERNGDFYGKNNMPYYGETYTLGVKVSGGLLMQNRVVNPWIGDADYQRVNESGKYKPVWYWTYKKGLNDSIYAATELELGTQYVRPMDKDSLAYTHIDSYSDFGLTIDETTGMKKGYMVWAYSSTNVQDSAMTVSLRQSSFRIEASADSALIAMSPKDADKVVGGLFVVPKYERGGRIQLMLAGFASKDTKGKWNLVLTAKETLKCKSKDSQKAEPAPSGSDEPTPIKKKDKKSKK